MTWPDLAQIALGGGTAGLSFGAIFVAVRWCANFIAGRMDRQEARLDAGTQRLIDRLEGQVRSLLEHVERIDRELEECRKMHAESEGLRLKAEGLLQGSGDARQLAALIIAAEKQKDGRKPTASED